MLRRYKQWAALFAEYKAAQSRFLDLLPVGGTDPSRTKTKADVAALKAMAGELDDLLAQMIAFRDARVGRKKL
jgi:hypothetical protein